MRVAAEDIPTEGLFVAPLNPCGWCFGRTRSRLIGGISPFSLYTPWRPRTEMESY